MNGLARCIDEILEMALREDLGRRGDVTSESAFPGNHEVNARIQGKEEGVLSGGFLLAPLFARIDSHVVVEIAIPDGSALAPGSVIAKVCGPVRSILAGERIALNFLQRLSGIATETARFVRRVSHTGAVVLDTRKTTPALRALEKTAVVHGGGENHRFGLYDMVLIKDTHVKACGGVAAALRRCKEWAGRNGNMKVEAEVQSVAQFEEALQEKPDRIMLDNMPPDQMARCVARARQAGSNVEIEASGNVTLDTVLSIAETGVDYISIGRITHSAPALDIHLFIV